LRHDVLFPWSRRPLRCFADATPTTRQVNGKKSKAEVEKRKAESGFCWQMAVGDFTALGQRHEFVIPHDPHLSCGHPLPFPRARNYFLAAATLRVVNIRVSSVAKAGFFPIKIFPTIY